MPRNAQKKKPEQAKVTITQLVKWAKEGRRDVLPALQHLLDRKPELWRHYGDIAVQAQASWLELIGGEDLYLKACLERKAAEMRQSLSGPDASPLEQLQAERIVAVNLQLGYYEALLAKHEGGANSKIVDYLHERCAATEHRLQQAMMNLARIRKLLPQVLKVDVVISGEIQTTAREAAGATKGQQESGPVRYQVPQNRIKDLLAEVARN